MNQKTAAPIMPSRDQAIGAVGRAQPAKVLDTVAAVRRYHRGQEICGQQTPVEHWYRVLAGVARKCTVRADGRRQIVDLLLPGDCFGFATQSRHAFAVEAVADGTTVACYPRQRAENLADTDARVAREIREMIFDAITRLQRQVLILGRPTALERVGSFLLYMAARSAPASVDRIDLQVSRYDIADYLALSSETVSRALTDLKFRGAIRFASTRQLNIVDRSVLDDEDETAA
jgi:CRP-like cAMP-binding protein